MSDGRLGTLPDPREEGGPGIPEAPCEAGPGTAGAALRLTTEELDLPREDSGLLFQSLDLALKSAGGPLIQHADSNEENYEPHQIDTPPSPGRLHDL